MDSYIYWGKVLPSPLPLSVQVVRVQSAPNDWELRCMDVMATKASRQYDHLKTSHIPTNTKDET
jgi:hypothetical protein